jgi:hypothetical protein
MSVVALVSPWRNQIFHNDLNKDGLPLQVGIQDPHWYAFQDLTSGNHKSC